VFLQIGTSKSNWSEIHKAKKRLHHPLTLTCHFDGMMGNQVVTMTLQPSETTEACALGWSTWRNERRGSPSWNVTGMMHSILKDIDMFERIKTII
jgi:hypothetical protein